MKAKLLLTLLTVALAAFAYPASAQTIVADNADAFTNGSVVSQAPGWHLRIGNAGGSYNIAVIPFLLPTLGAGEVFNTANLRVYHYYNANTQLFGGVSNSFNVNLNGLSRVSDVPDVLTSDFGASSSLLQSGFFLSSFNGFFEVNTDVTGDANLASFLNSQYAGGANAGRYVFLTFSPDVAPSVLTGPLDTDNRFEVLSRGAGNSDEWPVISYSVAVIPEPSTYAMVVGGLGLLVFLRRKRNV
jgi:hypothetical protein